jgi:hypothetical protein
MERGGLITILVGLVVAMAGSLPFMLTVFGNANTGQEFAGNLMWQAWALGGVVAAVGMVVAMIGDSSGRRFPTA